LSPFKLHLDAINEISIFHWVTTLKVLNFVSTEKLGLWSKNVTRYLLNKLCDIEKKKKKKNCFHGFNILKSSYAQYDYSHSFKDQGQKCKQYVNTLCVATMRDCRWHLIDIMMNMITGWSMFKYKCTPPLRFVRD
jgi:Sec7-like guanine-nucleotide exchange factor